MITQEMADYTAGALGFFGLIALVGVAWTIWLIHTIVLVRRMTRNVERQTVIMATMLEVLRTGAQTAGGEKKNEIYWKPEPVDADKKYKPKG